MSKFSKQFNVWHIANHKKYRTANLYHKALCKHFRNWKSPEDYSELSQEVRALKIENEKLKADKQLVVVPELTQKQSDTLNDYKNGSGSLVNYLSTEIKKGDYDYFARAWIDGYTVEKEQLYEIRLPLPNGNYAPIDSKGYIWGELIPNKYKLTESEVKNIDKRYWAFAVPV